MRRGPRTACCASRCSYRTDVTGMNDDSLNWLTAKIQLCFCSVLLEMYRFKNPLKILCNKLFSQFAQHNCPTRYGTDRRVILYTFIKYILFCCNTANPSSSLQDPCFYGSWQRVMVNFVPDKVQQAGKLLFDACCLKKNNPPDMFLLLKALREVPDGSDAVLRGQVDELLDQVLFLCYTQDRRQGRCYTYSEYRSGVPARVILEE